MEEGANSFDQQGPQMFLPFHGSSLGSLLVVLRLSATGWLHSAASYPQPKTREARVETPGTKVAQPSPGISPPPQQGASRYQVPAQGRG